MAARNSLAAIVVFLLPYAFLSRLGPLAGNLYGIWAGMAAAFAVYWYGCVEGRFPLTVTQVLLAGLIGRLIMLPMPPNEDIYRFIWEGKVLTHGFSPWILAPDHPYLAFMRDADWPKINHPHLPTLYPPVAQFVFWVLAVIGPSVMVFKLGFIACEGLAFTAMRSIATVDARTLAICFLNPLLIFEGAGQGHYDGLPMAINLAFFAALALQGPVARRWGPSLLGLGALAKVTSFALAPLILYRYGWKRALAWWAGLAAVVGATLWAVEAFDVLNRFATRFRFNGALPSLVDYGLPFLSAPTRRGILAVLFLASVAAALRLARKSEPAGQALAFMGLLILFFPTLHPWYLIWILPFAALARSRPWLLLTATVYISYEVYARAAVTGSWSENPWLRLPEYLPPLGLWLCQLWRERRDGSAA